MASIVSTGIGSGLDIAGIVQSLVAAEGQPVELRIGQNEAKVQSKLSAFGSLKSALSDFRDKLDVMKSADKFLTRRAISANEDVFTSIAGSDALPARYDVEVVQLAQSQKLTSGAFTDADADVGTGSLVVDVGGVSATIEITDENKTLSGIRDAINASVDNPGVSATIVNADSGSYIILTSDKTGLANAITVTQSGGDGGLVALEYDPGLGLNSLTESIAAQDALVRIDGLDVASSTNTIEGAIQGVTLDLLAGTQGATEQLTIENDESAARGLVEDFVASYNALVNTLDLMTDYDAESETAAPLLGDSTLRSIRDQIRRELSTSVEDINAPFATLAEIGIETQLDGTLSVNDSQLSDILGEEFAKFGQLFSTSDGFATRLYDLSDGFLKSDGIIETRSAGLQTKIDDLSDERDSLNERLASLETRLLRQFNALDSLLAQLNSTSNFLAQQLGNLPGVEQPGQQ
ncbi:MAG: flagellar filament capping protein FliD [Gammaproteobacteria bacterium]|nr:flagellar filament capping protein FliD [Gammaproteobacteria bacterium]